MTIPGFSAPASLARRGQYGPANRGQIGPRSTSQVSPAVLILVDGVEWGWIPGSVLGLGGLDGGGGGGGGGGGTGCRCTEYEQVCFPIVNCLPGEGCHVIRPCTDICILQECWT
jgi:hypothetical protein